MKRVTIVSTVAVVVLLLMAFVVVRAGARGRRAWCGPGWRHRGPVSYLARELKLNDAQRAQIQALWLTERPAVSADLHELLAENQAVNALAAQEHPDPGKVQESAGREAATIAKLLLEKEQLQAKIYWTVLNPEQRAKADALDKKWESRLDRAADRLAARPAEK